jgi:hypothetical protein
VLLSGAAIGLGAGCGERDQYQRRDRRVDGEGGGREDEAGGAVFSATTRATSSSIGATGTDSRHVRCVRRPEGPELSQWLRAQGRVPSSMIDRITPVATAADIRQPRDS